MHNNLILKPAALGLQTTFNNFPHHCSAGIILGCPHPRLFLLFLPSSFAENDMFTKPQGPKSTKKPS
ncbi:hypothetical protein T4D_15307 [Trichinella pseudospiralis]|uniref:Uncharacterized protein n=1 Tax=Trichinella pseudospiralis TaxID=6337 RepID=A0A0V1G258_TRIPS|nr:hypothetical protein T4D_15307 [Trichinella pseudospiralis]